MKSLRTKPKKSKPKPNIGKKTGIGKTQKRRRIKESVHSDAQAAAPDLLEGEVWADIAEYPEKGVTRARVEQSPGLQWPRVSNFGRFRDIRGIVKTPNAHPNGYKRVTILDKKIGLHCLVCRAFHGEPPTAEHTEVDHIDGNPGNPRADNLRWVTPGENIRHSYATNENRRSCAPQQSKPVLGRLVAAAGNQSPAPWVKFDGIAHAARELGLKPGGISACCRGKYSQTGGYEFEFDAQAAAPDVLEGEVWVDIAEYPEKGVTRARVEQSPGLQWPRVSNFGRYRDLCGRIKAPNAARDGYKNVNILSNKIGLHCLVCRAFHGEPPTAEHTQVDHIDGDPGNASADNLRWVTPGENMRHSFATNKNRRSSAPQRSKPVLGRRKASAGNQSPAPWVKFNSMNDAARELGLYQGNISACCRGKYSQTGGYEFKFDAQAAAPGVLEGDGPSLFAVESKIKNR